MAQLSDPSWADIISSGVGGLVDPSNRNRSFLQGVQAQKGLVDIEQTRQVMEEKRRQMDAVRGAIDAYGNILPREAIPAPVPGQDPSLVQFGPPTPQDQATLEAKRQLAIKQYALGAWNTKSFKDAIEGGTLATGYGNLLTSGIPTDQRARDVVQTQLTGKIPGYEHVAADNYAVLDPAGNVIGRGSSRDMRLDANTGQPIVVPQGGSVVKAGAQSLEGTNVFKGDPEMVRYLDALETKRRSGVPLSEEETQRAGIILDRLHPFELQSVNGRMTPIRKTPVSEAWRGVSDLVDQYRDGVHLRPQQAVPQPGSGVVAPAVARAPDAVAGGLVGRPAVPGAPPTEVPAAPPIVDPGPNKVGSLRANVGAPVTPGDDNALREKFASSKNVQRYEGSVNLWNGLAENMKVATPQADVNIIYALAKIMDPESVVREGEQVIFRKTGGALDELKGWYDRVTSTGAALTPDVRARLANMGEKQMVQYYSALQREAKLYRKVAEKNGIDPDLVIPDYGEGPAKIDRKMISTEAGEKLGPRTPQPAGGAAPTTSPVKGPATAPGSRTIRINPQTGAIEEVR